MKLNFDAHGLIPVVVQDYLTNEVLMVAWANEEAYEKMLATGKTHFWSRSRQKLWMKGETPDMCRISSPFKQTVMLILS